MAGQRPSTGHNAYMPGYATAQVAHHEWRTAENSAAYLLPTLKSMAEANPKLNLLDVGAGSGTISASLVKYIPEGHVTATDISEDILERAATFAEKEGVRVQMTFRTANIYELPFPDGTFDVVHASMVLAHLDSPVQAYKEMLRVTKPGGVVANRESDLNMWSYYPSLSGIADFQRVLIETMKEGGGNVSAGPQMVSWAMRAGATRSQITASMGTWTYSTPEERQVWGGTLAERARNGGMRKKALEMGIATEASLDAMAQAWDEWVETEDACIGCMHGEILIQK